MELRSLVSQAWESLKSVEDLLESGVTSGLVETALRWYLYSLHQNVLDALASLLAEAGLRKPASYSELAAPLLERGYAPRWFAEEVAEIARTRNLLARAYRRIPKKSWRASRGRRWPPPRSCSRSFRGLPKASGPARRKASG